MNSRGRVQAAHGVSERRSCVALGVERSTIRYRSTKPDQAPLRPRIHDLPRRGALRLFPDLHPTVSGGMDGQPQAGYRLYREEGLSLRLKRPRRHVSAANRERQPAAIAPNVLFASDALFDGRWLRSTLHGNSLPYRLCRFVNLFLISVRIETAARR